jgi:hypothetical protein
VATWLEPLSTLFSPSCVFPAGFIAPFLATNAPSCLIDWLLKRDLGYAAAMFGKWHLGAEPHSQPQNGFDEFYGIPPADTCHRAGKRVMRRHTAQQRSVDLGQPYCRTVFQHETLRTLRKHVLGGQAK